MVYIRAILAWILFGIGHLVSLTLNWTDGFLYPVYSWSMRHSSMIQKHPTIGPWKPTNVEAWGGTV